MTEPEWTVEGAIPAHVLAKLSKLGDAGVSKGASMAAFMELIGALKGTERTGWVDRNLPRAEHISDHMYRMAIICMVSSDKSIDHQKCMQIALVHDMAECIVGDITPYDTTVTSQEKHRRELETMKYLSQLVDRFNPEAAKLILDYWTEYETQSTAEARFVKDVDKLELLYQAKEYQTAHPSIDLADFDGVGKLIKGDECKDWAKGLYEYQEL